MFVHLSTVDTHKVYNDITNKVIDDDTFTDKFVKDDTINNSNMNSTKTIEDTSRHLKSCTYNNTNIILGSGVNKEQDSVNNSTSLDVEGNC